MKCRNCGSEVQDGKRFCGKCGAPMANRCPQCGKNLSPDVKFCPECGSSLNGKKTVQPPGHPSPPQELVHANPKKTGKWIAAAAALLILAGAGGFGFFRFALPLINKNTVEAENTRQESPDDDSEDTGTRKNRKESGEEDNEKDKPEQKTTEAKVETTASLEETTTASSFIWGGGRKDETTAAWGSEAETSDFWDGAADIEETGYILPDSNTKYLQESDLSGMTSEQLRLARNEIYARHGRMFDSQDLQDYFNRQPWYTGSVAPDDFEESVLNSYEKANLEVIKAVEAKLK